MSDVTPFLNRKANLDGLQGTIVDHWRGAAILPAHADIVATLASTLDNYVPQAAEIATAMEANGYSRTREMAAFALSHSLRFEQPDQIAFETRSGRMKLFNHYPHLRQYVDYRYQAGGIEVLELNVNEDVVLCHNRKKQRLITAPRHILHMMLIYDRLASRLRVTKLSLHGQSFTPQELTPVHVPLVQNAIDDVADFVRRYAQNINTPASQNDNHRLIPRPR